MLTFRCAYAHLSLRIKACRCFRYEKTDCYDTILAQNHIAPSSRPRTVIFGILVGYDIKYTLLNLLSPCPGCAQVSYDLTNTALIHVGVRTYTA